MRALLAVIAVLGASAAATAATYPKGDVQYAEKTMKASFARWAKTHMAGTTVGKVTCVLPPNGTVIRCAVHVGTPKRFHENIVFKVKGTLHETGTLSWVAITHSCRDTRTGKPFSC
jgi:TctA family transporter